MFASVCTRHVWFTGPSYLLSIPFHSIPLHLPTRTRRWCTASRSTCKPPNLRRRQGSSQAHGRRGTRASSVFLLFKWLRTRSLTFLSGLNTAIPDAVVEAVTLYNADVIATRQLAQIAPAPGPAAAAPPAGPAGSPFLHFLCPYSSPFSPIGRCSPNPQRDCSPRS